MTNPSLNVREMAAADIELIADYWTTSSPAHLQGMGVDLSKMPSRSQFIDMLTSQLALPVTERRAYCIIWEADGLAVGHCNTNPTKYGEEAWMHLHLWNSGVRQKGMGTALVKMTLPLFFNNLQLKRLYCEPYALNPAPHKTLEKAGFHLGKEYTTVPGSINFEQPVKQWLITRQAFISRYEKGAA